MFTFCSVSHSKYVLFSHPKGDPGKTGEQGSQGVAGQRVSAMLRMEIWAAQTLFCHQHVLTHLKENTGNK